MIVRRVVVSPHADDAEIGMLRLLDAEAVVLLLTYDPARLAEATRLSIRWGYEVVPIGPTRADDGHLTPTTEAVSAVEAVMAYFPEAAVFSPPHDDTHQDHRAAAIIAEAATRRSTRALYEYETVSARPGWTPTTYHAIAPAVIGTAAADLADTFASQAHAPYFRAEWLLGRAAYRGLAIGAHHALAFRAVRTTLEA